MGRVTKVNKSVFFLFFFVTSWTSHPHIIRTTLKRETGVGVGRGLLYLLLFFKTFHSVLHLARVALLEEFYCNLFSRHAAQLSEQSLLFFSRSWLQSGLALPPFYLFHYFIYAFIFSTLFGSPYLGKATAAGRAALPISNSGCSIFVCLNKSKCTRGLYGRHKRVCTVS